MSEHRKRIFVWLGNWQRGCHKMQLSTCKTDKTVPLPLVADARGFHKWPPMTLNTIEMSLLSGTSLPKWPGLNTSSSRVRKKQTCQVRPNLTIHQGKRVWQQLSEEKHRTERVKSTETGRRALPAPATPHPCLSDPGQHSRANYRKWRPWL